MTGPYLTISCHSHEVIVNCTCVCSCVQTETRAPEGGGDPPESDGGTPSSSGRYSSLWWIKLVVDDHLEQSPFFVQTQVIRHPPLRARIMLQE